MCGTKRKKDGSGLKTSGLRTGVKRKYYTIFYRYTVVYGTNDDLIRVDGVEKYTFTDTDAGDLSDRDGSRERYMGATSIREI